MRPIPGVVVRAPGIRLRVGLASSGLLRFVVDQTVRGIVGPAAVRHDDRRPGASGRSIVDDDQLGLAARNMMINDISDDLDTTVKGVQTTITLFRPRGTDTPTSPARRDPFSSARISSPSSRGTTHLVAVVYLSRSRGPTCTRLLNHAGGP